MVILFPYILKFIFYLYFINRLIAAFHRRVTAHKRETLLPYLYFIKRLIAAFHRRVTAHKRETLLPYLYFMNKLIAASKSGS